MIEFFNKYLFGIGVPVLLIFSGIYYAILLRCFHLRRPLNILKSLTKRKNSGGTSPFRALTLALAGTLGVGNIVGVTSAIALGGFGAIFWMWISAICAMLLKYAEILLAMKHRVYDGNGAPHGAAMYYIKAFFSSISLRRFGGFIAGLFAFFCIVNSLTMGSMMQANAVAEALEGVFSVPPLLCGTVMALFCLFIVSKGANLMSRITEIVIPMASAGYIAVSVAVIFIQREYLPDALRKIISDALTPSSAAGGALGFLLSRSLRFGTIRGLISNEAGCGTAPAAHATSSSNEPVEQGFWGIFEVFVDTIVLCTMTALVLIINFDQLSFSGSWMMLCIEAYKAVLGEFAAAFLGISVLCFGASTIICWAHYGVESLSYLTSSKAARGLFITAYSLFVLLGTVFTSKNIWAIADLAIGAMTMINIFVLLGMRKTVKKETERYFEYINVKKKKINKKVEKKC